MNHLVNPTIFHPFLLSVFNSAFTASNCAKYSELSKDIKVEFFLYFVPLENEFL